MPVLTGSVHAHILTKPSRAGFPVIRLEFIEPGAETCVYQAKACSPTDQPDRKFKDGLGINMTMRTFFTLHITSCEKHSLVVYILRMNPTHGPRAWSLNGRSRLRAGGREQWTVLSGTSTIEHGLLFADRAQGLTGT